MRKPPIVLCALLLGAASLAAAADQPLSAADQVRQMQRGVNIVGYDPLWQDPGQARFKPRHFQIIRQGGFDAVRIALMAFRFMDERNELPPRWFATLDGLVQEALAQKLTVIIDEHDYNACGRDVVACRPKLMAFWTQVAAHYKDAPDKVVFEILNEPNQATNDVWNDVHAEALAIIREDQPHAQRDHRAGVLEQRGLARQAGAAAERPAHHRDRALLPADELHAPGRGVDTRVRQTLRQHLGHERGLRHARPGFRRRAGLGQDSTTGPSCWASSAPTTRARLDSRVKYTAAVARAAEKRGWAWAYWQFDRDFIVYDIDQDQWVEPIHRALIPGASE